MTQLRPRNQSKELMNEKLNSLGNLPNVEMKWPKDGILDSVFKEIIKVMSE